MRRAVIGLAIAILLVSFCVLVFGIDPFGRGDQRSVDTVPAVLGFGLIGAVLIAIELGHRRIAWLALVAGLLGFISIAEEWLGRGHGIESWLTSAITGETIRVPGPMPAISAFALLMVGCLLPWLALNYGETRRLLALAMGGSLLGAVGMTTLAGYALSMPMAYRWGSTTNLPPVVAILMLLIGGALLALAWTEHRQRYASTPAWLPVPVIVACGTFTIIFWAGLRERETAYLGTNAQIAINTFASNINLEFERQSATLERMARRWTSDSSPAIWESDAVPWMLEAPGAQSLSRIATNGSTVWYYPLSGNESLIAFNQFSETERRTTLESVAQTGTPLTTSTLELAGRGPGFAIYAPIYRASVLVGYIGAEFTYQRFLEILDHRLKLSPNHRCAVYLGQDRVYSSVKQGPPASDNPRVLESVFILQNRRLRIVMEPTDDYLRNNRRYLPEISLAAGLGITLLLGLSIHLARAATTSLGAIETTNRLLREENEERRRIEKMLKVSDERLRLALDATVIGIFEWDCVANTLHYSTGLWAMLGLPPGDEASTPEAWQALIHPDDLPAYQAAMQTQLGGTESFIDPEYRVRTVTGEWRWLYMRSKTVGYSEAGATVRIVGTLQDVTARHEAEQALRSSQSVARKLSLVASRTDNLVLIATPDGTIEWVNESFERVMEFSIHEVVGRNPTTFMIGPETNPRTIRRIKTALAQGEGISTDIVNYSKSGRKYHLHLEIQPVRNERGMLENFIAIEADITARVETENALRRAKAEADTASRAKSEFLASMSHEIRTPMNGVIGMTSLLLDTPLNDEQRDSVNTIRTSGEALLTIINDLLDFSKIESGKLELEHQPFEFASCIEETLDLFAGQAAARRIEVSHYIEPDVPAVVLGDVNRLRQVLSNLVNNAIKFTPKGRVTLTASVAREDSSQPLRPGHTLLTIAVRDSGIGIPAERLDRLFKPFSQVDSSTTRKYGGTGLGLVICHRLCSLMGGDIRVHSESNQGSTFTFTVQVEPAPGAPIAPTLPAALLAGPVLCIDDNPVNLRRLTTFFQSAGITALPAASGEAALQILGETRPSAAVLDLDLPDIPGERPLHKILVDSGIPVIGQLVTGAAAAPAWSEKARFAAVPRPLRTIALIRALQTLFPSSTPVPSTTVARETLDLATRIPLNVLLVEDNPVNQKVALRFLDRLGYRADAVANGIEAINAIGAHHYQLVFMDLQMPEMDGFEATRHIRGNLPAHRQPCIIALTANALQSDRDLCLAAGMNDFITKPIKLGDITETIRRHFGAPAAV
ncbi:MAG: barA 2 [Rariglobus sp.]|jgi:PAS domain S-box-containing protein|nr:barA 2 [Rariglobus sp.]